ncbi:hypothetical protein OG21DRAFT_1606605 [Imleria badia]|nr:hypothetical protein OG21DRAFT_1606605 [Imleria badia]
MNWLSGDHEDNYNQFDNHKASMTHELLSGGVAYEAAKAYENHCQENGHPVDHATAKAVLAGFTGAAADRLVETKGLDYLDREQASQQAQQRLSGSLGNRYGVSNNDQYGGSNNDQCGGSNNNQYGGSNNDQYGGSNNNQYGGSNNDQYGGSNNDQYGSSNNDQYGGRNNDKYGASNNDQYGSSNNDQY